MHFLPCRINEMKMWTNFGWLFFSHWLAWKYKMDEQLISVIFEENQIGLAYFLHYSWIMREGCQHGGYNCLKNDFKQIFFGKNCVFGAVFCLFWGKILHCWDYFLNKEIFHQNISWFLRKITKKEIFWVSFARCLL